MQLYMPLAYIDVMIPVITNVRMKRELMEANNQIGRNVQFVSLKGRKKDYLTKLGDFVSIWMF